MFQDLYEITASSRNGDTFVHELALNAGHLIFRVHFPGTPITPGACQMEILRQLAGRSLGSDVMITEVRNIKYLQVVSPDANPCLTVEESFSGTDVPGTFKCNAVISSAGSVVTKTTFTVTKL